MLPAWLSANTRDAGARGRRKTLEEEFVVILWGMPFAPTHTTERPLRKQLRYQGDPMPKLQIKCPPK